MNKKLKKKRVPECNDAYKAALVQKVLDAEVVYEWECILKDRIKIFITSLIAILGGAVSFAAIQESPGGWIIASMVLIMSLASYFLFYADQDYLCQVTPYGIRSYETERVPEACYKFMRGSAYVGIVVCVIAVIFVGPMAFVGAGGSALMAFQMRNFHKHTEVIVKPFSVNMNYEYNPDDHPPEESSFKNGVTKYILIQSQNIE